MVALESTVLTHGMPREPRAMSAQFIAAHPLWNAALPANLAAAQAAEARVRAAGAIPATIALVDGRICVGLRREELERLCGDATATKVSLRDFGSAIARGRTGGTTVAATAAIAAQAGISLFATGGIGGVHRGWIQSFDLSADLLAIATHPVLVVSAGVKVILDLPATMEALESLGVPVIGYRTKFLPRFTAAPDPAIPLPDSVDEPAEAARVLAAHWSLRPNCGALLMQACPTEFAIESQYLEGALAAALAAADLQGVRGAATTPFLLGRLAAAQGGAAVLEANLALLCANASLAGSVAAALAASALDRWRLDSAQ